MARTKFFLLIISSNSMEETDKVGKELANSFEDAYYERQYFSSIFPVIPVKKWFLTLHPGAKVVILGNMNYERFGDRPQLTRVADAFMNKFPFVEAHAMILNEVREEWEREEDYEREKANLLTYAKNCIGSYLEAMQLSNN